MKPGIGDQFQQQTEYVRDQLPGGYLDWGSKPETYKRYPDCPKFDLPAPKTRGGAVLWDLVALRRSVRDFLPHPLPEQKVSQLLWASQGVTAENFGYKFRASPSAGALYPVETYLVINNVENLPQGVYHYSVEDHTLEQLKKGDYRVTVARAALDQRVAYDGHLVFLWTAVFERAKWKYKQRAYRYIYLDAGHIAQSVVLAAMAEGLGSCQIGAIYDEEANDLLGLDSIVESTIYMTVVGTPQDDSPG